MKRILIATFILLVFTISVYAETRSGTGDKQYEQAEEGPMSPATRKVQVEGGFAYTDVNAQGLATMLGSKDFMLINVHIPYEGEIEGTDLLIPYNDIERNLDKLPSNKGAKILLYCRSGRMSDIAARALVKMGYTNIWNLDGGMIKWKEAGYPLLHKK